SIGADVKQAIALNDRLIPCRRLLGAGRVRQAERSKRGRCDCSRHANVLILLISGESGLAFVAKNSVDRAMIITEAGELRLYCTENGVAVWAGRRIAIIVAIRVERGVAIPIVEILAIVVRVIVGVVIRVIAVAIAVVGIVIPWVEAPPGTGDKNKDVTVIEVRTMPVPITMPIAVLTGKHLVIGNGPLHCCGRGPSISSSHSPRTIF